MANMEYSWTLEMKDPVVQSKLDSQLKETQKLVIKSYIKVLCCGLLGMLLFLILQLIGVGNYFKHTIRLYSYIVAFVWAISTLLISLAILYLKNASMVTAIIAVMSLVTMGS